jgi:hypothetical protein
MARFQDLENAPTFTDYDPEIASLIAYNRDLKDNLRHCDFEIAKLRENNKNCLLEIDRLRKENMDLNLQVIRLDNGWRIDAEKLKRCDAALIRSGFLELK